MTYINESLESFLNEMARMTPEERKARRKERRAAKKKGIKLPRLNKKNKCEVLPEPKPTKEYTPEELLCIIQEVSPHYKLEWENWGGTSFSTETGERGSRTDHGGGEDGDEWMDDEQIDDEREPYVRSWKPKMERMMKDLKQKGINADWYLDYGEKGHISLEVMIKK